MDRMKAQSHSLHFLPRARGKAFEPGSGRITTRPQKNNLVKEGVSGLLFVGGRKTGEDRGPSHATQVRVDEA